MLNEKIPISLILVNPEQPRKAFDPVALEELAASIREHGVINPIVVEAAGDSFVLHDGERRVRAARLAGLTEIPAIVRDGSSDSSDRLLRALVANLQRSDLSPIEEMEAFNRLAQEHGMTHYQISQAVGKSVAYIRARLAWVDIDQPIQQLVAQGRLCNDSRLATALARIPDPAARVELADTLAKRSVSLRASIAAADKLTERIREQAGLPKDAAPAVVIAVSKKQPNRARWNALAEIGKIPPWEITEHAAIATCERCSLRDVASHDTCGNCPVVEFLSYLLEKSK